MAAKYYDCFFILDSNRYARDPGGVAESIKSTIESVGGEILVSRLWAEQQKLAYPVNGHSKGTYWLTYCKLESTKLKEINRPFQLNESILRFMFTVVDERLIDALVAHAQGKQVLSNGAPVAIGLADDIDEEELEEVEVE